ncbi:MAG: hypothetical protein IKZ34_04160 [Alphaproteobacteria bacterium]|nr:hypothetical protein [Alphaproteobacteria bacterium]
MKVYKRVFPYMLAAGALFLPALKEKSDSVTQQAVVMKKRDAVIWLDTNDDGVSDKTTCLCNGDKDVSDNCNVVRNNIKVGDTLKFHADKRDLDRKHAVIIFDQLDSVNSMSRDVFLALCRAKELQKNLRRSNRINMELDYTLVGDTIEVVLREKEISSADRFKNSKLQDDYKLYAINRQKQKVQ